MGSGSLLKLIFENFDLVAGPVVTLVYPLYASVKAIETKSIKDDQQWLTYWVLYSFITLFELTFARVLEWIPIWSYAKLIFSCWLVLPQFSGAAYVYQNFVRPMFVNHQNIWSIHKTNPFSRPDNVLSAVENYTEENGPEEYEKMMNKMDGTSKSRAGRRSILEEVQAQSRSQAERESNSWTGNYSIFGEDYRY